MLDQSSFFQLHSGAQKVFEANDVVPDEAKTWKSWSMTLTFNKENLVFKIGSKTVFDKKWTEMTGWKAENVKRIGHWHRAYSGTWKKIEICQGTILANYLLH